MRTADIEAGCCSANAPTGEAADVAESLDADSQHAPAPQDDPRRACLNCGGASRPVTRRTVLLMLEPVLFGRVGDSEYRFCSDPDCSIVYFTEGEGATFTTDDLRIRVGLKERADPITLCYCFGFNESDARGEITNTGATTIPQHIAALIKQGMCACPERNPSGACCLGEVNRAVKRLMREVAATEPPT